MKLNESMTTNVCNRVLLVAWFILIANISSCGPQSRSNVAPNMPEGQATGTPNSGGANVIVATPAPVSDKSQLTLTAGLFHTCLLNESGKVYCWGGNSSGQLGSESTQAIGKASDDLKNLKPVNLGSNFFASQLFVGAEHNCAVDRDGQVKCWGRSDKGQLGIGDELNRGNQVNQMGDNLPYVRLPSATKAVSLSLGISFTCALLSDTRVVCWGEDKADSDNGPGILGRGTLPAGRVSMGDRPNEMGDQLISVTLGANFVPVKLASGSHTTCALSLVGRIKCWGSNKLGELGRDAKTPANVGSNLADMGESLPFVDIGSLDGRALRAVDLVAGYGGFCVTTEDGATKCWGEATYGRFGLGSYAANDQDDSMWYDIIGDGEALNGSGGPQVEMGDKLRATDWGKGRKADKLSLTWGRLCGVLVGGSAVRCYGVNRYDTTVLGGAFGIGKNGARSDGGTADTPRENQGALKYNSGDNAFDAIRPQGVATDAKMISVTTSSYDFTCVLYSDATFACFGDNSTGGAGTGLVNTGLDELSMQNLVIRQVPK